MEFIVKQKNAIAFILLVLVIGTYAFVLFVKQNIPTTVSNTAKISPLAAVSIITPLPPVTVTEKNPVDETLTSDFSQEITKGSPLIFGGSSNPRLEDVDAWNKIADVGVTSMRKDMYLDRSFVKDMTYQSYVNNNSVSIDFTKWDKPFLESNKAVFDMAKKKGMKNFAIISFMPKWLALSNDYFGPPSDWNTFEDVLKKAYAYYRDSIDYVEIWNEPTFNVFWNMKNSNLTPENAYLQMVEHSIKAIREVDNNSVDKEQKPLGFFSAHSPSETSFLNSVVSRLTQSDRDNLQFVSYHNYHISEPSWNNYLPILNKYGLSKLPIYLTEWNYNFDDGKQNKYNTSENSIPYVGSKFIGFLNMGLAGANYYSLNPLDITKTDYGDGLMRFYRMEKDTAVLMPASRTWMLMSKTLGLGKNTSTVFATSHLEKVTAASFINSDKIPGVVIANQQEQSRKIQLQATNLQNEKNIRTVAIFVASITNEGSYPVRVQKVTLDKGDISTVIDVPPLSVVGVLFNE